MKENSKVVKAIITSLIFVSLYFGFLYLPAYTFKIALGIAVLGFLTSLYFDPYYRFFKIALLLIGVSSVNASIPAFNLLMESDYFYLNIIKNEDPFSVKNLSLFFGGLFCLLLDFLRENGASHQIISVIGIGNTVNHTIHNHNSIDIEKLAKALTEKMDNGTEDKKREYILSLEKTINNLKENKYDDALALLAEGKKEQAEKLLIQYANKEANKSSQAWVDLGNIVYLSDYKKAREYYQRAVDIDPLNINAQYQLGHYYRRIGDYPAAKTAYEFALNLDTNTLRKAVILENIGVVYQFMGELDEALNIYNKCLSLNRELDHKESLANNYCNIGNIYQIRGDLDHAIEAYQKGMELNKYLNCTENIAKIFGQLGNIYQLQKKYDDALEMYDKSININKTLGLKESLAFQYGNVGIVYTEIGEMGKAMKAFDKSVEINTVSGHQVGLASNYSNIANVFETMGDFDKSLSLHQDSVDINQRLDNKIGLADNYQQIGSVYCSMKDFDQALTMCSKSLNINEKLERKIGMANNYGLIGDIHQAYGNIDEAIRSWKKSKLLLEESGNLSIAREVEELIRDIKPESHVG